MDQPVKQLNAAPGFKNHPDHKISVQSFHGRVKVRFANTVLADTKNAVLVHETNHAEIYYIPMEDIKRGLLTKSSHVTRCPFKGKASYWNINIGDHEIDNALWAYEMPYDEMLELAGLGAFYASKVEITAVRD